MSTAGIAGCCAKSTVAPFDRVKILLQAHHVHYRHLGRLYTACMLSKHLYHFHVCYIKLYSTDHPRYLVLNLHTYVTVQIRHAVFTFISAYLRRTHFTFVVDKTAFPFESDNKYILTMSILRIGCHSKIVCGRSPSFISNLFNCLPGEHGAPSTARKCTNLF